MRKIVIIGNGISGITCARNIRKLSDDEITIISAETEHFYSRTALMYVYMGHMKYEHLKPYEDSFWKKNRLDLVFKKVIHIQSDLKSIIFQDNTKINYDILIIATGSITKHYDWPGQELDGVSGFYNFQDLGKIEKHTKDISSAVIVGGGLIGVELAEMFHSRNINVTLLVRDQNYWGSVLPKVDAQLVGKHIEQHGINILYNSELKEILPSNKNTVGGIITKSGKIIKCDFVGISTGVIPNISFLQHSKIECDKGILINNFFETSTTDIYAIGDCAQFRQAPAGRKHIEQIWYTGRMHGETLASILCRNKKEYKPGPFFNSAKFFDLEYQTYGIVPAKALEDDSFYTWKHPQKEIQLTFVYNTASRIFKGINCFGTRLRHEFFDHYLRQNGTIEDVISNFKKSIFDKEFERNYFKELLSDFNNVNGSNLKNKTFSLFK